MSRCRCLRERARLFRALGDVFDARFEGRGHGAWAGLDAVVLIGVTAANEPPPVPTVEYVLADGPAADGEYDPAQGSPTGDAPAGHPTGETFPDEAVRYDEPEERPRSESGSGD